MRQSRMVVIGFSLILCLGTEVRGQDAEGPTPEELCLAARQQSAGIYAACQATEFARFLANFALSHTWDTHEQWQLASSSCHSAYSRKWEDFQHAFPGTTCGGPRFVDNGNGTVTDNLTGFMWQQSSSEKSYSWSAANGDPRANGTVFTEYLAELNREGACSAGQCDWRLPSLAELQTLLNRPWGRCIENGGRCYYEATDEPCDAEICAGKPGVACECKPCVEPVFSSTSGSHWVSDEVFYEWFDRGPPQDARFINFKDGQSNRSDAKYGTNKVRAVRGGL